MNLMFDFTVDKSTATIYIKREFAADLDLVWDAFTQAEILDQWWGPKPMRVQTKEMDFREGGRWLYTMLSGEVSTGRWSLAEFIEILPKSSFTTKNSFTDENGDPIDTGLSFSITKNAFEAGDGKTTVVVTKKMANLAELEQFLTGGHFEKGMEMVMSNLDEYLENQSR